MLHSALKFKALAVLAVFAGSAGATQVMHRPPAELYKAAPKNFAPELRPQTHIVDRSLPSDQPALEPRANGKVSIGYFTNWGIYTASNFQPSNIVVSTLTHVLYSFADTDPSTGAIKLTDPYADTDKHYETDSWNDVGNNVYGCIKQLYLLKLKNRNLKVLLSVGGWTYSQSGHFDFVTSASSRAKFVADAVQLVEDNGLDGIDLDFEYPTSPALGQGFADLITSLRTAFTALQARKNDAQPYTISAAVAAGPNNYQYLVVPQMNAALTFWNLMAYDYAGSWLTFSDNQANVYGGTRTGFSTDAAIKWYVSRGATISKIVMGMPLYGRAFENTNGLGQAYSGIGPGSIEAGIYSYKHLPLAGAQIFENNTDISSYSYDAGKKELVSYDTPNIIKTKAQYVNNNGMAGSMFWELSTDKVGADSLIGTSARILGSLDTTPNHISYPNSKWDNIRSNMGGAAPTSTTGPTPTGIPCGSTSAWSSAAVYVGGQTAAYGGHIWYAKWWTTGEVPGTTDVWRDDGVC